MPIFIFVGDFVGDFIFKAKGPNPILISGWGQ